MSTLVFGLGTAPAVLWNRSWEGSGNLMGAENPSWDYYMQGKYPPRYPISLALGVCFEAPNLGPFSSCTGFQASLSAAVLAGTLGRSPASPLALMLPRTRLPGSAKNP